MSQLTYSVSPAFTDLADATIAANVCLTDTAIQAVSDNAKFGAVRCEQIEMGFYKNGDTVPLPISPVDGYVYIGAEVQFLSELYSTRAPLSGLILTLSIHAAGTGYRVNDVLNIVQTVAQGGAPGNGGAIQVLSLGGGGAVATFQIISYGSGYAANSTGLATTGGSGTGCTINVLTTTISLNSGQSTPPAIAAGQADNLWGFTNNVSTAGVVSIQIFYGSQTTYRLTNGDGIVKVWCLCQRTMTLGAIPAFLDIPLDVLAVGQPLKQGNAALKYGIEDISHNAKLGAVRHEVIFQGFWASGYNVSTDAVHGAFPVSPVDGYVYAQSEITYKATLYSTCQPDGFTNGQSTAPPLSAGSMKLRNFGPLYWWASDVDDTLGLTFAQVSYYKVNGAETITGVSTPNSGGDGIFKVFAICQRSSSNADVSAAAAAGFGVGGTSGLASIGGQTGGDTALADAPLVAVVNNQADQSSSRYHMLVGIQNPGNPSNWNNIIGLDIQVSTDSTFATFPAGQSLNLTNGSAPGISAQSPFFSYQQVFDTNFPGTYYIRSRVWNGFGAGVWSGTGQISTVAVTAAGSGYALGDVLNVVQGGASGGTVLVLTLSGSGVATVSVLSQGTGYTVAAATTSGGTGTGCTLNVTALVALLLLNTSILDNTTLDIGLVPGTIPTVFVQASNPALGGNEIGVAWPVPLTNSATMWGTQIFAHSSNTLPVSTTFLTGTHGAITSGVAVMTDTTATFTPGALVGKNLFVFNPLRAGSPSFDMEGMIVFAAITANTSTTITFSAHSQNLNQTYPNANVASGAFCKYYVCNVGNDFFSQVAYASPWQLDPRITAPGSIDAASAALRSFAFAASAGLNPAYVWISMNNLFGQGPVGGSPGSATYLGITQVEMHTNSIGSPQIINANVLASKLTANSQGWNTDIVFSTSDYRTVVWTSGHIKTADGTTYAINSGNVIIAALTYFYLNTAVSTTVLQATTNYATVTGDGVIIVCLVWNSADITQKAVFIPAVGTLGINNTNLSVNSVTASNIQVTTLSAISITAFNISVVSLDAFSVNAGTITAGTFIGTTFETAVANPKISMTASGITSVDSGGTTWFSLLPTATGTAGIVNAPSFRMPSGISGTVVLAGRTNAQNDVAIYTADGTEFAYSTQIELKHDGAHGGAGHINFYLDNTIYVGFSNTALTLGNNSEYSFQAGPGAPPAFTPFYMSSDSGSLYVISLASTSAGGPGFFQRKARGTHTSLADVVNGDKVAVFGGSPYSAGYQNGADMLITVDAVVTSGQAPATRIDFRVNANNAARVIALTLKSSQIVQMPVYGAGTATFDASGNISSVSDERLKQDIETLNYGLAEILKLRPVTARWTEESGMDTKERYCHFIAQEVGGVMPDARHIHSLTGLHSYSLIGIVGALVNSVKELNNRINAR